MIKPRRPRTYGAAVVVALLAVLATACSSDPTAPTTTAPAGYRVESSAKAGFAVAVPSDWITIPLSLNPDVFNKNANALRLANPKLASILNQARVLGQSGGTFMAVAPDGIVNVNLTVDKPKEKTVAEIVANSVSALKNLEATSFGQEPSTLSGLPGMKLTFRLPVETDSGRIPTDEVQHYLLKSKKAYILTVAAAPGDVASAIAGSLRLN